jgi:serine/threonine protein kinase
MPRRVKAKRLGPYRVEGELGRGGMGVVYRAFDERLHRDVALKALPAELAADPSARARLEREARALALVSHANVAAIFSLEEAEGTLLSLANNPIRPKSTRRSSPAWARERPVQWLHRLHLRRPRCCPLSR